MYEEMEQKKWEISDIVKGAESRFCREVNIAKTAVRGSWKMQMETAVLQAEQEPEIQETDAAAKSSMCHLPKETDAAAGSRAGIFMQQTTAGLSLIHISEPTRP